MNYNNNTSDYIGNRYTTTATKGDELLLTQTVCFEDNSWLAYDRDGRCCHSDPGVNPTCQIWTNLKGPDITKRYFKHYRQRLLCCVNLKYEYYILNKGSPITVSIWAVAVNRYHSLTCLSHFLYGQFGGVID